jgi:hypothetical protein
MSRQLFEDAKKVLLSEATKLDPVGREDKDIDNDGDSDKTDSYLKKRRGAISAAIAQSKNEGVELSEEDAKRISTILKGIAVDEAKKMKDDEEEMEDEDDEKDMKESADQIDEVSREKLAAYKNKASDARYRKTLPTAKLDKREAGVAMAMKKLDKKNEETELDEGSVSKEKQKTPYRDINSPESRAAASAQRERMASADKAEAGKKLLGKIKQKNEEVEQVDERVIKGKGYDNPENMRKAPEGNVAMTSLMPNFDERSAKFLARQVKGTMVKGKAQSAPQKEDIDLEDYDLIEKFEVNIPEMPSYQDYVNAALKIAECKAFSELSEEDQQYIMNELEEAVNSNDVSFILEAEAMSDMSDTVQRLKKAGHKVEDMGRDYKGNPFYMYIDKMSGMRRKVTYKGNQKMTQNMGRVQTDKKDVAEANDTLGSQFDDFMASRNANRKPGQPMMKPRTAQSVIKPGGPKTPEEALKHLNQNIPLPRDVGYPKK